MSTPSKFQASLIILAYLCAPVTAFAQDVKTTIVPQTLTNGTIVLPEVEQSVLINTNSDTLPYKRTFIVSAYYSPLKNQTKYVTGSYAGDIKLNGGGVHGADGTDVYPGMLAAPSKYSFGTKINIPGLGIATVHDRGGAIVTAGQRNNAYDRLDVWMGYGDAGRDRALKWGKRTVDSVVYGVNDSIAENFTLNGYTDSEKYVVASTVSQQSSAVTSSNTNETNKSDSVNVVNNELTSVKPGSTGDAVSKLQTALKNLNYYSGDISGTYDEATKKAVTRFQLDQNIIASSTTKGAGYAGPKTISVLVGAVSASTANAKEKTITQTNTFNRNLKIGDSGDDVKQLQEELRKLNLLGIETSSYYGEITEHAVMKFQQINKLVGDSTNLGAGIFGDKTRATLNSIIQERTRVQQQVASINN